MNDRPKFQPSAPTSPGSMTRAEFDALSPHDKARAVREGWHIYDGPAQSKPITISRATFDKMPAVGQQMYLARGGTVSDSQS